MKRKLFLLLFLVTFTALFGEELANESLIFSITASSTLADANNRYAADKIVDGTKSSWSEGVDGPGIGEHVTIDFGRLIIIESISIKNGYGDYRYYEKNNRVKELQVNFCSPDWEKSFLLLEDNPGFQEFVFERPVMTDRLKLVIEEVYPGSHYDDTCIAEIKLNTHIYDCFDVSNEMELNNFVEFCSKDIADDIERLLIDDFNFQPNRRYGTDGEDLLLEHILEPSGQRCKLHPLPDGKIMMLARVQTDWLKASRLHVWR